VVDLDQFAVRFIPRENGVHSVYVRVRNELLPESPFRVIVGAQVGDASLVAADGYGLNSGYIGQYDCVIFFRLFNISGITFYYSLTV